MIGMLLDVGNGLKKPEAVRDIMDGKDVQMSLPAESYALFLKNHIPGGIIIYENNYRTYW